MDHIYEEKTFMAQKQKRQFVQIVATAYHNAGVECEFLRQFDQCLQYYQKAFGIALGQLGSEHVLT